MTEPQPTPKTDQEAHTQLHANQNKPPALKTGLNQLKTHKTDKTGPQPIERHLQVAFKDKTPPEGGVLSEPYWL